jgi:hypothetical protein
MMSNLSPTYLLRQDRIRRIHERFYRGELTETVYRRMLAYEGYSKRSRDTEVEQTMISLSDATNRILQGLK